MSNTNIKGNESNIADNKDLNLGDFTKDGFKSLTTAIRHSNTLPANNDWNFHKLNASFCKIMNNEGDRLLRIMNSILKYYDVEENINARQTIDDKIDLIVEANDTILEKVGDNLDELNGIKKKNIQPVEFQMVTAQLPTISGSWNRINKAVFSVNSSTTSPREDNPMLRSIHLLTGKNIIRPQTFFKDKIDNSNAYPWQPRITEKPNSIKPLALVLEETEFGEAFGHPYEVELDKFDPPPDQLKPADVVEPKPISETPLHQIETLEQLNDLVDELRKHKIIAVDLEHHSYRSFMGITCLMQISTTEADYIIDTLVLRDKLHILNEIFTKPSIIKVFHGAELDVQWLQRDLSLYVVNMFDTHQAAKQLGYSGLSLAYLLQRFCKCIPNKHFQLADWRIRPLPDELLNYAREDTHYLIYIYGILKNELLKQGNGKDNVLKLVIKNSTEICKKVYIKPRLTEESHLDFYRKCKRLFDNKQMYALKELYQWRDKIARQEDESTGYVLPNHMLLQIADVLPREMQGILACCNPIPPLIRSNLLELHQIILRAREQSAEKPIMKEDNRSMGSTQQFSKINIESSLHCPHDFTKQSEFRDDLPVLFSQGFMTIDEWERRYSDGFTAGLEKKKSKYSVFDSNENSDRDKEKQPLRECNLKFLGPYERYKLVKPFIQAEEEKEAAEKAQTIENKDEKSTDDRIASLHEHFLKVAKECQQKTDESALANNEDGLQIDTFASKLPDNLSIDIARPAMKRKSEENQSLTQMQGIKRRKTTISRPEMDASFKPPDNPLHTPVPNIDGVNQFKKKRPNKRKRKPNPGNKQQSVQQEWSSNNERQNEQAALLDKNVPKNKKKQFQNRKKQNIHNRNGYNIRKTNQSFDNSHNSNTNFEPFDYSTVDYRQFQGGAGSSGGNNQKYNSKFKGKNKKSKGRRNNKFSTFPQR